MTWDVVPLGTVMPFKYGKGLPERDRSHSGEFDVVSSAGVTDTHNTALTAGPSVVIGRKGTIGKVYYCPQPVWPIDTAFYVEGSDDVDVRFAYYLLGALGLAEMNNDSAVPGLNRSHAESLPIALPSPPEQRAIAAMLGALDDKIESNQRASALIEELLAAAFQRVLVTEPIDYIPLADLAVITKGVSYKSADLSESRTSLVTLKSFNRNGGYKAEGLKPYIGPYKPAQVVRPGEVVVAQTDLTQGAEVVGRAVRVPSDSSADTLVASLDLVIVRPTKALTSDYLLGVLTDEAFRQHCRNRTNGTTVLHLAGDAIPTYEAPVVSAEAQATYSAIARPLIARRDALEQEIATLRQTRDALLPDLLSGRIRIFGEVAA